MKKVLYVHGGLLNMGGTESVMMNYYRKFDPSEINVDFALHGFGKAAYDDEVLKLGGRIFNVVPKGKNIKENKKQLTEIIKNGDYIAVHSHMDAGNATVLKIAKECGVPVRISHSHNTATQTSNPLKKLYNFLEKKKIKNYATNLFACSDLAGKWLYGNSDFTLINNAVDAKKFEFSPSLRANMRKELNLSEDTVAIGHIGRFSFQKNHEKLIDIFEEYYKSNQNSVLLLIGEGETKSDIASMVEDKKLSDVVRFIPPNDRINEYMQAFDVFCMPSRFEGLPVVVVEAQAAGLPVVLSDTVSKKSAITDLVDFVPLNDGSHNWCEDILKALKKTRTERYDELCEKGFDITANAKKMQHFYLTGELLFK